MQCRYCEQNKATFGLRALELSFQRIPSSAASGEKADRNPSRSNVSGLDAGLDAAPAVGPAADPTCPFESSAGVSTDASTGVLSAHSTRMKKSPSSWS